MKKTLLALAVGVAVSAPATAADMYINLGTNVYDIAVVVPPNPPVPEIVVRDPAKVDADFNTGIFTEFGFSQILATSIYDLSEGSIFGSFYDTNIPAELTAAGVPASGLALDGSTTVNLVLPNCPAGQCDIDALSPLVPPINSDSEGFLLTWDLQVAYHFDGTLTAGGPTYNGGTFEVFFNSFIDDADDRLVLSGVLTGSDIDNANLFLYFLVDYAETGFLWVDDGTGTFHDASTRETRLTLDTNVNPPIPTVDQLLLVGTNAIRQTTLDGSITAEIPEPGTLALLGLGLAGLGLGLRRKKNA